MRKVVSFVLVAILAVLLFLAIHYSGSDYITEKAYEKYSASEVTSAISETVTAEQTEAPRPDFDADAQDTARFYTEGSIAITAQFLEWFYGTYGANEYELISASVSDGDYAERLWHSVSGKSIHILYGEFTGESVKIERASDSGLMPALLAFGGDVGLDDSFDTMALYKSSGNDITACFDAELLEQMTKADIFTVNNEFAITDGGTPLTKRYLFRAPIENLAVYEKMGVDVVSLGNNHAFDYGTDGFADTVSALAEAKISYIGAGVDFADASSARYFDINGIRVALTAATRAEKYISTPAATVNSSGVLRMYDLGDYTAEITAAKQNADFVIAYAHWGREDSVVLEDEQIAAAHALVDAGADIVIGAHTHTLQSVEYYNGKPIFYSLGNLWWDGSETQTALLLVSLMPDGNTVPHLIPCITADARTSVATGDEKAAILERLNRSQTATVADDGRVTAK